MCGIAGILNKDGDAVSVRILENMTSSLKHRGPDGEGVWVDKAVGFGHRRLAILDLTPLGHQPMATEDGSYVITYNGELYNYQNLRVELEAKGHQFRSRTDTEVVLKSYQEWGSDCLAKFNGMFAFAIWDSQEMKLFIARDRFGIKPLYYCDNQGTLLFASEIKAILKHPAVGVRVSVSALNEYFSFQNTFSDLTLFEGIKMLPPGHSLTVSRGSKREVVIQQYWDYDFNYENELSESEYVEELRRLFDQAVKRQLISDVEVGSYLSGGIDSGSITCLAAKSFKNLKTFTCGFDLSSASGLELGFDEREKAEFLSNIYKTEHYEVVLKAGDMERIMPELIWHLEDLRVGQSYPNFYISRLASKFVKVVLSGAGGDELFAGYPWRYFRSYGASYEEYMNEYYSYWQRLIPDSLKPQFFVPDIYPQILSHSTLDVFKSVLSPSRFKTQSPTDFINHSLYFEIKTFLPGILLVEDKLSMAHSLETRTPFLDNDLVNFALNIPIKYKLRDNNTKLTVNENDPKKLELGSSNGKLILRKVLSNYVPHHYANGLKQGFSAPDASWFKGESIDYIKSLLFNKRARIYDFIQPQTAQALMNEHFSGKTNRRLLIWSLLCFEWWNRIFDPV